MKNLQKVIFKEFGLNVVLKPFGENERGNVFQGKDEKDEFIIKLENIYQLDQVKISIEVASNLLKSNLISSSKYLKTKSGECFLVIQDKVVTIQIKEKLTKLSIKNSNDVVKLGEALGEFHLLLMNMSLANIAKSDFYTDFMWGDIPLAQSSDRLEYIEAFYQAYSPNYDLLTHGVVHNDLNISNIFRLGKKYFIIDFEFLKESPLVSDLGVFVLEIWNHKKGVQDYLRKLKYILQGYEKIIKLTEYDKSNIIIFSLRYLFSDENWYTYWSLNGNPASIDLIPEVKEMQNLLFQTIR